MGSRSVHALSYVRVIIGDRVFIVSDYHAGHVADALIEAAAGWEQTAVSESRRVMKQGGGFDHLHPRPAGATYIQGFEAAEDARKLGKTHEQLAIAFLHAENTGNSHYKCDPTICQGARDRLARIAAKRAATA